MKDRVRQVMTWAKLSQQDFATYLEISPASLSSIFNGRTNPTNNHVQAIHRAFPEINVNWLMFGEGEMLTNSSTSQQSGSSQQPQLSIFGENAIFASNVDDATEYAKEIEVGKMPTSEPQQEVFKVGEPQAPIYHAQYSPRANNRRITHIVVYYNDNTFETFRQE